MRPVATVAHPHIDAAEYLALQSDAGWRLAAELIGGEAVVIPPSGGHSASVQGELFFALRSWQQQTSDRGLLLQDVFVALPHGEYLAPDIAWWSAERRPPMSDGALHGVPELVVEVLSPATRANDLGIKRELYRDSGVRELWLVDPAATSVTCVREAAAGDAALGANDTLTSELLAGFRLTLSHIF